MTEKFDRFAALHVPGDPVILYNIWDVGSAHAVEQAGAKALATGSHPVADANGWPDGQGVPIDFALANAARIVDATTLPVTVDFEGGYSTDPDAVGKNVWRLAHMGVVGCNFEDQVIGREGLHPIPLQAEKIRAIRKQVGDSFFINARTDLLLKTQTHDDALIDRWSSAARRSPMPAQAASSSRDCPTRSRSSGSSAKCRCRSTSSPFPARRPRRNGLRAGVARISHGPFPHRALMKQLEEAARAAIN